MLHVGLRLHLWPVLRDGLMPSGLDFVPNDANRSNDPSNKKKDGAKCI